MPDLLYCVRVTWAFSDDKIDRVRLCKAWPIECFCDPDWSCSDAYEWATRSLPTLQSRLCRWEVETMYQPDDMPKVQGKTFDEADVMQGVSGGMRLKADKGEAVKS